MKGALNSADCLHWRLLAACIVFCGATPIIVAAQETAGAIVVARDVPERHAFLPGAGEPLIVKTAPFSDVWGGINPGKVLSNDEANAVVGQRRLGNNPQLGLDPSLAMSGENTVLSLNGADGGNSFGSGVGAIVGQALDSGLNSLKGSLDQVQAALGSP